MTRQCLEEPVGQQNKSGFRLARNGSHLYLLAAILTIYATLSLFQINLPGLHYDEAFEAVPALQMLLGQPVTAFRNSGIRLGGQLFPFMTQDYIGALNTYAAIPFIAIWGATPMALRVMSVIIGAITIWLAYALTCALTGHHRAGLAAALLLAVDPTFIFWNRQGIFVTAITAAIGVAATFCWLRRWQTGQASWAVAGAFLFGLGLYAKLLFLWLIGALIGTVLLLNLPGLITSKATVIEFLKIRKAEIVMSGLAFILGCWPLIIYNVQTAGTFLSLSENAGTSFYGVNNLAFGSNLLERLRQYVIVLNGSHLWYLGDIITNPLCPLAFGLVLLIVIVSLTTRKSLVVSIAQTSPAYPYLNPTKAVLFPFLVIALVLFFSVGTVSALWVTHFALLMPWPAMALTIGGWYIYVALTPFTGHLVRPTVFRVSRSMAAGAIWVGLGLLVATNLQSVLRYHFTLIQSGGLSSHSDAVYDLSDWLAVHADGQVVAMDWGLAAPVTYLTYGQLSPTEVFGYTWQPDTDLTTRLEGVINQSSTLYLWRAPDEVIFDRSQDFKTLYRPLNLEENIKAAFYERSGRPILGVTELVPKGSAENPPK